MIHVLGQRLSPRSFGLNSCSGRLQSPKIPPVRRFAMSSKDQQRTPRSTHPYLTGNFAPVSKCYSPTTCSFTGTIPHELIGGQYVRNGGNPISNSDLGRDAHWFDGDGMLAGVLFKRSPDDPSQIVPQFVNQFILTDVCLSAFENSSIRTPILPSIATLVSPIASLFAILFRIFRSLFIVLLSHLPRSQQAIKRISVANTNILFHDGRALATCESGPPIRVQLPGLETVGWFDGNGVEGESSAEFVPATEKDVLGGKGLLSWMREWSTGHPKIDPVTGEMILFHCSFLPPYVHYSVIPSAPPSEIRQPPRKFLNAQVLGCTGGKMMHDFGVSSTHTVILDLPLTLTPFNLIHNKPVVSFEANEPARFGVFPRYNPSAIRWFETSGCCIFHTANTWDEYGTSGEVTAINMLACRLTSASLVFSAGNLAPPSHSGRRKFEQHRPMSFFASYDDDETAGVDLEKDLLPHEKIPLLASRQGLAAKGANSSSQVPPVSDDDEEQCRLYYYQFSFTEASPTVVHQYALSSIPFEFPTLNPAYEMSSARFIYGCSTSNESFGAALGKATKIDVLVKMDVKILLHQSRSKPPPSISGCVDRRSIKQVLAAQDESDPIRAFQMPPGWYAQEARFVARERASSEDDGYLLFYAFDESQLSDEGECIEGAISELWVLDAKNMQNVLAKVQLPQRVPYGLHGNWFTEDNIQHQRAVESKREMKKEVKRTVWSRTKKGLIGMLA